MSCHQRIEIVIKMCECVFFFLVAHKFKLMPQNTSRIDWRKTDGKTGAFFLGIFWELFFSFLNVAEVQHLDTVKCYDLQLEGMGDRARVWPLGIQMWHNSDEGKNVADAFRSRKLREPQPADSEMMRPKPGLMASLRGHKCASYFLAY